LAILLKTELFGIDGKCGFGPLKVEVERVGFSKALQDVKMCASR
jgi:hypothetical protein